MKSSYRVPLCFLVILSLVLTGLGGCGEVAPTSTPPGPASLPTSAPTAPRPAPTGTAPVASPGVPAARVPLKDAVKDLEPRDVWQNFYNLTQIPRPSHHEEKGPGFPGAVRQGPGPRNAG